MAWMTWSLALSLLAIGISCWTIVVQELRERRRRRR